MDKKLQLIIGGGLILLVVLGLLIWWQQPARVVNQAVEQLGQTPRQHFTANLQLANVEATEQLLGEKSEVTITANGAFDRQAAGRPALAAQMTIGAKTESVSLEIAGEVRFIGDQAYFVISKAPASIPALAQLKGQWIELPRGEASQESPVTSNEQLFTNVKRVGSGHYQATGQAAAIVQFMNQVASLLGTQLTAAQIDELRENVASVKTLPVELWVTPWQHRLTQLAATLAAPSGNDVHLMLKFTDPNRPVNIQSPDGAKSLQDALAK